MNVNTANAIEISIEVEIQAGISFWVDKTQWTDMSDAEKRALIYERMLVVANYYNNDVVTFDQASLSAAIIGPKFDAIDLNKVQIYNPED